MYITAFVAKSVELTRKRKVGNPFAADVLQGKLNFSEKKTLLKYTTNKIGPQIDAPSQQKILKYIELGNKQGAKLEIGGKKVGNEGFFVEPTIFSNVTDNMAIAQEEVNIFS